MFLTTVNYLIAAYIKTPHLSADCTGPHKIPRANITPCHCVVN